MSDELDQGPDYRFLLANERTFLAYVRTALSLQVAGLAVLQFLTGGHTAVRLSLGLALVASGSLVGVAGWFRFRDNDRRIRSGQPFRSAHAAPVVALVVAAVPLVAAVLLALT